MPIVYYPAIPGDYRTCNDESDTLFKELKNDELYKDCFRA